MQKLRFSIITICFNAEMTVRDTMESVINQEFDGYEYIIVDGKSSDRTNDIIKEYIPRFEKKGITVKYISEKDKGISDAFNKGIRMSSGEIIALINSGDALLDGALSRLDKEFKDHDDIIYGNTICNDPEHYIKYMRTIPDHLDLNRMKYDGMIFTHQSSFVRSSVYEKYGLYDTSFKYVMDTDLFLKFYQNGIAFRYVNFAFVSMLAGGVSSRPSIDLLKENIRLSKKYGGYPESVMWMRWIAAKPKQWIVSALKRHPSIWYMLIGKKRCL